LVVSRTVPVAGSAKPVARLASSVSICNRLSRKKTWAVCCRVAGRGVRRRAVGRTRAPQPGPPDAPPASCRPGSGLERAGAGGPAEPRVVQNRASQARRRGGLLRRSAGRRGQQDQDWTPGHRGTPRNGVPVQPRRLTESLNRVAATRRILQTQTPTLRAV
jgi:hypothetical protein